MGFIFRWCFYILLWSGLTAFSSGLEGSSELKVAYVSVLESAINTGEQSKMRKTMAKERSKIEKAMKNKDSQFKKEADKIKDKIALLSDDEKAKQYEKMQRLQLSMQQFMKQKNMEFQKKETDLNNLFMDRLKKVIAGVAKKNKVSVVRNRDAILWVVNRLDITQQVVKAYKKKYK